MKKAWLSAGYSRSLDGFEYKAGFGMSSKLNSLQIYICRFIATNLHI